ncbi:Outer membrane protein OmpA [Vibrio xiamenensis]|uniref:Outer membrane protein OmpA n=1 Tax=Vibrio xiamenensis TaxID=861298 RepID=A0A1G8GST3_9VIBR|nr:OmpA family protein [Vibrio xiamenensis]SDH97488.1 Outer membrane protein OmpA [Vibrio xiamenensis]
MKSLVFPLMLLLSGCVSLPPEMKLLGERNLLHVAPKDEYALMHPEWGYAQTPQKVAVRGLTPMTAKISSTKRMTSPMKTENYDSLESFLMNNGIDYEVLPGNHVMVKVKDMIKFNTGSARVSPESKRWLEQVGHYIANQPGIDIVINGHTDNTGTPTYNDKLSEMRADAVKNTLMSSSVMRDSIYTRGFGEYVPECSNQTRMGKACNRRVEVMFIVSN